MRLDTDGLNKHFGGVAALDDVSLEFVPGSVTAVIGPNGAGKSTLFNVIAGYLRPDSGHVYLSENGSDPAPEDTLVGLPPHQIARRGVGVLFQDVRVFERLSAFDNVAAGVKDQPGENPLTSLIRPGQVQKAERKTREVADRMLEFVGLSDVADLWAGQLSYGQQKLVALARLLAGDSQVLLLDEPMSGVHPDMVARILKLIKKLADNEGRTVVMIEHNLNVVKWIGDWVYLMAGGRVEVFGRPDEVLRNKALNAVFPNL